MLLTRAPLYRGRSPFSLDLHVLGAPLTFVLSQDQTLQLNPVSQPRLEVRLLMLKGMIVSEVTLRSAPLALGFPLHVPRGPTSCPGRLRRPS